MMMGHVSSMLLTIVLEILMEIASLGSPTSLKCYLSIIRFVMTNFIVNLRLEKAEKANTGWYRVVLALALASIALCGLAQQPCSYMYHVTEPEILDEEPLGSWVQGCSGTPVNYPQVFGPAINPWLSGYSSGSCLPHGKSWKFHMRHGASANCQAVLNNPTHTGELEFIGPYMETMTCVGSCGYKTNITYDHDYSWKDDGNTTTITYNNYSAFMNGSVNADVIEIFNIKTPSGSDRRMLLAFEEKDGKPRLEGFYGWWNWLGHFVVEGKVLAYQWGCTNPNACNYDEEHFYGTASSCAFHTCDCDDPTACNYDNNNGQAGITCEYNSCRCLDEMACNYNAVTEDCEYTSCQCNNANACNYANGLGYAAWIGCDGSADCIQNGQACEYTSCDCNDSNAVNYNAGENPSAGGMGPCVFKCDDSSACNYEAIEEDATPCVYPIDGSCGDDCILSDSTFDIDATPSTTSQDQVVVTLNHTISAGGIYDYNAFDFKARVPGGEWKTITWQNQPSGTQTEGATVTGEGTVDFANELTRCSVSLEIGERNTEVCRHIVYRDVPVVSLSEAGCSDPRACNFKSLCADGSVTCTYAQELWNQNSNGEYTTYVSQTCGSSIPAVTSEGQEEQVSSHACSSDASGQEQKSFILNASVPVEIMTNALVVNGSLCEYQSAHLIAPNQFKQAILPEYVPKNGSLLSWVDIGHNRNAVEDLWAARTLTSLDLVEDRFGNPNEAIQLSSNDGFGGLFASGNEAPLLNYNGDGLWSMSAWTKLDNLSTLGVGESIVLWEELFGIQEGASPEEGCTESPIPSVPGQISACCQTEYTLDVGSVNGSTGQSYMSYSWSTGENSQAISVTEDGSYSVTTTENWPVSEKSIYFDGTAYLQRGEDEDVGICNQLYRVSNNNGCNGVVREESFVFWIKPTGSGNRTIFSSRGGGWPVRAFHIYLNSANKICISKTNENYQPASSSGASTVEFSTQPSIPNDQWTHVALSSVADYDCEGWDAVTLYVDGINRGNRTFRLEGGAGGPYASGDQFIIGKRVPFHNANGTQGDDYFTGYLSHFMYAGTPLNYNWVQAHKNCPAFARDVIPDVIADWQMQQLGPWGGCDDGHVSDGVSDDYGNHLIARPFYDSYPTVHQLHNNGPDQACIHTNVQEFDVHFSSEDVAGVCGGTCLSDNNTNGICDDIEAERSLKLVKTAADALALQFVDGGLTYHSADDLSIEETWNHFGFSGQGGNFSFVFNSIEMDMELGEVSNANGIKKPFVGMVDDFGLWSEVLNVEELQALYSAKSFSLLPLQVPYGSLTNLSSVATSATEPSSSATEPSSFDMSVASEVGMVLNNEVIGANGIADLNSSTVVSGIELHAPALEDELGVYVAPVSINPTEEAQGSWSLLEIWNLGEDTYSIGMPAARRVGAVESETLTSAHLQQLGIGSSISRVNVAASTAFTQASSTPTTTLRHIPFGNSLLSWASTIPSGQDLDESSSERLLYSSNQNPSGLFANLLGHESAQEAYLAYDCSMDVDLTKVISGGDDTSYQLDNIKTKVGYGYADTTPETLNYESIIFNPSYRLGSFSPSEVLDLTDEMSSNHFAAPVDLGFQNSNLPGLVFGDGDGQTRVHLSEGADIASSKVRIAMPLVPNGTASDVITGADAITANLPFWGIPNGVDAYAEMHVVVKSATTPLVQTFSFSSTETLATPLLRNAPYLLGDSLVCEIGVDALPQGFAVAGHAMTFDVVGIWATPGRKCVVTDRGAQIEGQSYASNEIIFCGDPGDVVLTTTSQEVNDEGNFGVNLSWNEPDGGRVTLQRQMPDDSGWTDVITFSDLQTNVFSDVLDSDVVSPCSVIKYRLKIFICDALGQTYSNTAVETIQGENENPWDSVVGENVVVSKGTSPASVDVSWSAYNGANDIAKEAIDVFELQRRIYAPDPTIQGSQWEVIATMPTSELNFQDENLLAGYLYEYRVSANILCTGTNANAVRFESKEGLGFRHGIAEVSGDITFQLGTAVDSVRVEGDNLTDLTNYHLTTNENEFLQLDVSGLNEDLELGFNHSFWWKASNVNSGANNEAQTTANQTVEDLLYPVASWWYRGLGDTDLSELFSLQISTGAGASGLHIYKSGEAFGEIPVGTFNPNQWNHITIQVDLNSDDSTMPFGHLKCTWWDGVLEADTVFQFSESIGMIGNAPRLEQIVFGAAPEITKGCINEHASNFDAFANAEGNCDFGGLPEGCTDENAIYFDADNIPTHPDSCVFDVPGVDVLRINWYFDVNAEHFPIVSDASGNLIWQGDESKLTTGSVLPNEPATFRLALTPGHYTISPSANDHNYIGTFAVISESHGEVLPYTQYTDAMSDVAVPFQISPQCQNQDNESQLAFEVAGLSAPNSLNTGCATCHSWQFNNDELLTLSQTLNLDVNLTGLSEVTTVNTTPNSSFSWEEFAVEFWVQVNDDISQTDTINICGLGLNSNIKLGVINGRFAVTNPQGASIFANHGTLYEEELGVSDFQPWLWYHVVLSYAGNEMVLDVKPIFTNDEDGDPWNDGLHSTITGEDLMSWRPTDDASESLVTFGSSEFKGLIHRFSLFNRALTEQEVDQVFLAGSDPSWSMPIGMQGAVEFVGVAGSNLNYNRMLPLGQGTRPIDVLSSSTGGITTVFRAPSDHCQRGCIRRYDNGNDLTYTPSDFNPFVSEFDQCDLSGLNVSGSDASVSTTELLIDHAQLWSMNSNTDSLSNNDMVLNYRDRHVPSLEEGLLNYLDFDERVGVHVYDRSRTSAGDWRMNHAVLRKFESSDGAWQKDSPLSNAATSHYHSTGGVIHLKHYAYTDGATGQYVIQTLKLSGSGSQFEIEPSKVGHFFQPNQLFPSIPDGNRIKENQDFFDLSSFNQDLRVVYASIEPEALNLDANGVNLGNVYDHSAEYQQGTSNVSSDPCPVAGATILIDGLPIFPQATEDDPQPESIKTGADGLASIEVPIGVHTISVTKDGHTFDVGAIQVTMVSDANETLTFIDNTSRRAVGTVLGGSESQKPFGSASNNVGFAKFALFPVTADQEFATDSTVFVSRNEVTLYPMKQCPAIPVQTDEHGAYSAQLLPMQYVIMDVNDAVTSGYALLDSVKQYMDDGVESTLIHDIELLNESAYRPEGLWYTEEVDAFILNMDGSQSASYFTPDVDAIPDGADDFEAIVYTAEESLLSWDVGVSTSSGDTLTPQCPTVSEIPVTLQEVYNKQFIGDWEIDKYFGARKYKFDAKTHFNEALDGYHEKAFPAGKPIIQASLTPRCMAHAVMAVYGCVYEYDSVSYSFDELALTAPSATNPLSIVVIEEMYKGEQAEYSSLWDGEPITRFVVGSPELVNDSTSYVGTLEVELRNENNVDVGNWKPYIDEILALQPDLGSNGKMEFYVLGDEYDELEGQTLSTAGRLDMILRDPPGDGSYTTLLAGSTKMTSREQATTWGSSGLTGGEVSLGLKTSIGINIGAFLGLGGGTTTGVTTVLETEVTNETSTERVAGSASGLSSGLTESLTITQSISTSAAEQDQTAGDHQDLYFGVTENISRKQINHFGFELPSPNNESNTIGGNPLLGSAIPFVCNNCDEPIEAPDGALLPPDYTAPDTLLASLGWSISERTGIEPASYFLKTEHIIENVDIPGLEAMRDSYFANGVSEGLYAPLEEWQYEDAVPEGMYLANNDDPRWVLFHQSHWIDKISLESFVLPLRPAVYSSHEKSGPGYTFTGNDLADDKVRYYNDLILQWKLFIAQNELEKLNARELLKDNLQLYDNIDEISNPLSATYGPNLDNGSIPIDADITDIASWGHLDFAPFFITFSGGGSEYTQSYSKSTVESQSSNRETFVETDFSNTTGLIINGNGASITAGSSTSSSSGYDFGAESETMLDFSFTLTDDEEDDYQFVAVMPGKGANSAIFLTINANGSSCPWLDKETPNYAELFPLLYSTHDLDRAIEQTIDEGFTVLCPENSWQVLSVPQAMDDSDNGSLVTYFPTRAARQMYMSALVNSGNFTQGQADLFETSTILPSVVQPKAWSMMDGLCAKVANMEPLEIQPAQYPLQQVDLDVVESTMSFGANINDPIVFTLRVENQSTFGNGADYTLKVKEDLNTLAANVSFAGGSSSIELSSVVNGTPVDVPVVVEANGLTDFENLVGQIGFYVQSNCDSQIKDEVTLNFGFTPDCSPIELDTPVDGWLANTNDVVSASNFSDADLMTVQVSGINMKLNNFEGGNQDIFEIQIRRANATEQSNIGWKTVRTVSKTDNYADNQGVLTIDSNEEGNYFGVISRQELFNDPYNTTVPFEDDAVEIRAVSTCINGLRRESNVAMGVVDLVNPFTFGKPIPQDGIYDLSEQFVVRFNEAMNPTSVQNDAFSIRGFFNGHDNWEGAMGFDNHEKVEVLDAPNLLSQSWRSSVQVYPAKNEEGVNLPLNGVFFSQVSGGDGIEIRFNQGDLEVEIFNAASGANVILTQQGFDSEDWSLPGWKTLELEFVFEGYNIESELEGYFNISANGDDSYSTTRVQIPQLAAEILQIGNSEAGFSNLNAAIKDIRFWQIPSISDDLGWTSYAISNSPFTHSVNGTESGLVMWISPSRESGGIEVGDWARHRVVSSSAHLLLPEGGYSLAIDAVETWAPEYQNNETGSESMEFWMKRNDAQASIVMSDMTWQISSDDAGHLMLEMHEDFSSSTVISATPLDVGIWYHIAVVGGENQIVKMYVDGLEVASGQFEESFRLSHISFGGSDAMNGNVDEVRLWSKSLLQEEIEANMYVRVDASNHSDLIFVEHFEESAPNNGMAEPTGILSDGSANPLWDASTYAYIGLDNVSETAIDVLEHIDYNALNDEFLLTFKDSELYKFEDQVVTVEMDQTPSDELGNELGSSLSWNYFFDRSPLKLSVDEWSESFILGESASMTAQLFNESIEVTSFEIVDVPTWLNVQPLQGAIGPLGTVEIEISTTDDVDLGMHVADIRCIDPNFCQPPEGGAPSWCFGENLLVELDVVAEEMEFEFDDSSFSENMAIVARVMNGGFFSHDPEDLVLAYINGELCGVAKLDVDIDGQQFAFLTVYYDAPLAPTDAATTPIDFRVWDASRGIIFTSVETFWPTHQNTIEVLANSATEGDYSVFHPLLLRTSNRVVQSIDLEEGWNWISFNVEDDRLQEGPASVFSELNGKLEEARNQLGVAQSNGDSLYNFGLVTSLNDMYQVKLNEPSTLELSGLIPDRIEDAQSLISGWQHLGYNAQRKLPINVALQHLADNAISVDGDVIKSRSHGFAVCVGDEWVGSLTHMEPDQGYKLYLGQVNDSLATNDSLGVLVFPADAMIPGFDIRHESATPDVWEQDVSELMATSTAIVRIETTRPVHRSPHDVLGAFAEIDDEWKCVGQAFALSQDGDALYFLTTYTEGSMTDLTFKWYSDEESQSFASDDHALFIADEMRGTLTDPFVLRFETPHADLGQSNEAGRGGVADDVGPCSTNGKLQVYPSLVDDELAANVFVECDILSIDVVDVTGNRVTSLPLSQMGEVSCQGTPGKTLTCDVQRLASGMYRLVVRTEEGILVAPFVKAQ